MVRTCNKRWINACRLFGTQAGLLLVICFMSGCEVFGMVASAVVPPTKPAVYTIADRATVVIVDDPNGYLKDPQLSLLAAANCTEMFREKKVIKTIVSTDDLAKLAIELGDRYPKTSPRDIGHRLGAKQVILIHVFGATDMPEPGLIRPAAEVGVKLFDVDANERLFPPSSKTTGVPDTAKSEGFYRHKVALRYKVTDANQVRAISIARQKLAEEIGRSVARLFFEHDPTEYDDIRSGG